MGDSAPDGVNPACQPGRIVQMQAHLTRRYRGRQDEYLLARLRPQRAPVRVGESRPVRRGLHGERNGSDGNRGRRGKEGDAGDTIDLDYFDPSVMPATGTVPPASLTVMSAGSLRML